ncbi:MAG: archaeosortase/exosortase family protein [Dissulfurispiraceae bacterium]
MKSIKTKREAVVKDKQFLKVGILFCSLVILLDLLVWYLGREDYLDFLDIFLSDVMTGLISLSGLHVIQESNMIYLTNSSWIVATECTAIFIMLIYSSFVLVYPASVKSKGIALLVGIPSIFGANILRLYCMAWIDYLSPQFSEFFHDYMWQVAFIVMVVFMWLVWIEKVVTREKRKISFPA